MRYQEIPVPQTKEALLVAHLMKDLCVLQSDGPVFALHAGGYWKILGVKFLPLSDHRNSAVSRYCRGP